MLTSRVTPQSLTTSNPSKSSSHSHNEMLNNDDLRPDFNDPEARVGESTTLLSSNGSLGSPKASASLLGDVLHKLMPGDRRRRQTMTAAREFSLLVRLLSIIAGGVGLLSLVTLSGVGAVCVIFALATCVASLEYCRRLVDVTLQKQRGEQDELSPEMRSIAEAISSGAEGFLSVQYNAIKVIALGTAAVLFLVYLWRGSLMGVSGFMTGALTACAFLAGALCSAGAGYVGVWSSVRVNSRVAAAAAALRFDQSLLRAFRGGAVSALLSASLCTLGLCLLYTLCYLLLVRMSGLSATQLPALLGGYGFGASFVALFMQLGGGIYTKASDVGADLVGKIEQDIPEDDPRNPAVIADLVGDNVGDCAGSMADVFESIAAELIGAMILGAQLARQIGLRDGAADCLVFFPVVIHTLDLIVSAVGIHYTRPDSRGGTPSDEQVMAPLQRGFLVTLSLASALFVVVCRVMLHLPEYPTAWFRFVLCGFVGLLCSFSLVALTQYYTDYRYGPVKKIHRASATGHATNIIAGLSVGMESCGAPVLVIAASLLSSFYLGSTALPHAAHTAGLFGTAVATMGMLSTAVYVLAMNNFGPIADNAGGIVEMAPNAPAEARVITDRLDAVGNTTKAQCKGFSVGASALACFVLFQAFFDEIEEAARASNAPESLLQELRRVDISQVHMMVGGLLGIAMVFVFVAWAIDAVGRTAQQVVWEVRRQFSELPGVAEGTAKPDYRACIAIVTRSALREMVRPAVLALATPVGIGLFFRVAGDMSNNAALGVQVLASFLVFATLTGLLMAIFLDNAGGAWDNTKKLLESQQEKGSVAHKAAVTGDTVGDPCKDTAGPALHVIITTMSTTALVLGPLFIGTILPEAPGTGTGTV